METESAFSSISTAIFALLQLLVLASCVILVYKKHGIGPILMLCGTILSGIMQIVTPFMYSSLNYDTAIINIMTLISIAFYGLFALGVLLLAIKLKQQ